MFFCFVFLKSETSLVQVGGKGKTHSKKQTKQIKLDWNLLLITFEVDSALSHPPLSVEAVSGGSRLLV